MSYPILDIPFAAPEDSSRRLADRRALVTSADSELGRTVAVAFAREGANVAISFAAEASVHGELTAQLVRDAGGRVVTIQGEMTDPRFDERLVAEAARVLGGVDVLVVVPHVDQNSVANPVDVALEQNVYPLFRLAKSAESLMDPGSTIITTNPVPAEMTLSGNEANAGVETITTSLAARLRPLGVTVNGVAPSTQSADAAAVASAYVYLASAEAAGTTGQMLVVA